MIAGTYMDVRAGFLLHTYTGEDFDLSFVGNGRALVSKGKSFHLSVIYHGLDQCLSNSVRYQLSAETANRHVCYSRK